MHALIEASSESVPLLPSIDTACSHKKLLSKQKQSQQNSRHFKTKLIEGALGAQLLGLIKLKQMYSKERDLEMATEILDSGQMGFLFLIFDLIMFCCILFVQ